MNREDINKDFIYLAVKTSASNGEVETSVLNNRRPQPDSTGSSSYSYDADCESLRYQLSHNAGITELVILYSTLYISIEK